jgi:hypothetical protein
LTGIRSTATIIAFTRRPEPRGLIQEEELTAPYPPPAATPAGNDKTTLWGVLGIVIGFLCCPILGVVFGILSINEAKKAGKPNTLGVVAIVASVLGIVLGLILNFTVLKK